MASAAKTLRVSFVQCRGTPYEIGRAQADAFAATRKGKAFLRKQVRLPNWFNIHTEERAFRTYAPGVAPQTACPRRAQRHRRRCQSGAVAWVSPVLAVFGPDRTGCGPQHPVRTDRAQQGAQIGGW